MWTSCGPLRWSPNAGASRVADGSPPLSSPSEAAGRERHGHVVVGLGERVAVSPPLVAARLVGRDDLGVGDRGPTLEPREQGGADVEADAGVVVGDLDDAPFAVEDARGPVRRIALRGDPRVPVMVRSGGVLDLDLLEPGVFARGLVEMPVDADEAGGRGHSGGHATGGRELPGRLRGPGSPRAPAR